jgi:hypothetical protein
MVLPLLVGAALRVGAGAAARGAIGRVAGAEAANSVRGRVAAQAVGHYGVNALQRSGTRPQRSDHGFTQWIRENPGEATFAATGAMIRGTTLSQRAMGETNSLLQSTQFNQTP